MSVKDELRNDPTVLAKKIFAKFPRSFEKEPISRLLSPTLFASGSQKKILRLRSAHERGQHIPFYYFPQIKYELGGVFEVQKQHP